MNRTTLISYLDDYLWRGSEIMFVQRQGLRRVSWSYEQVVLTARRTARELERRGIEEGQRVILWGKNSPEWVAAFWGCLLRGVIVVPIDTTSTVDFYNLVRQQTDTKLVFVDAELAANVNAPIILQDLLDATASQASDPYPLGQTTEDTPVEIIFTSGTTSTPKGVVLTHRNLLANLLPLEKEIAKYLKWERIFHPIRFLHLVPLSHVFGQFMGVFVPQLLGGEVHFLNTLNPAEIVRRTRESRVSVVVLVPRVLHSLRGWVERTHSENLDKRLVMTANSTFLRRWWTFRDVHRRFGWKFWAFISGGATLDEETESFWQRLGYAVLQGYGMTETASLITVNHPFKHRHGSIGKPLPGYELMLDETGEILVRGEGVSSGYWNGEGQVNSSTEAWLHTGDVGAIDEGGNLYFRGRQKDVIVSSAGLNIHPDDLESALNQQPEVLLSCVIKWQGERGDEPMAAIILRDPKANASAIIDRTNQTLADYQQIRHWHIWTEPDFPRTPTQKVIKRKVAARIKEQDVSSPVLQPASSFILSTAEKIGGEALRADNPSLKLTTDLKLDSLGRIELLSALEDRFQIDIDEASFTAATTVGDVERIVRGELDELVVPFPYPKWSQRFPITWIRILLFYLIILPITRVMSRMQVKGLEHIQRLDGPALFVANHVTLGDHALILVALPKHQRHRLATAMEGERLRTWLHPPADTSWALRLRWLAQYFLVTTFFHVFPLPKRSGFRRSFSYAGERVDRGDSVLVFPEGERAPKGQMEMSPFKAGIGVLSRELNVPVVPVKLNGLYELKRRQQYFATPGMVSVVFGAPVRFDAHTEPAVIAAELQRRVDELR